MGLIELDRALDRCLSSSVDVQARYWMRFPLFFLYSTFNHSNGVEEIWLKGVSKEGGDDQRVFRNMSEIKMVTHDAKNVDNPLKKLYDFMKDESGKRSNQENRVTVEHISLSCIFYTEKRGESFDFEIKFKTFQSDYSTDGVMFLHDPNLAPSSNQTLAASFIYIFKSDNGLCLVVAGINGNADIIFQCVSNSQSEMDYFQPKQTNLFLGFSKYYLDISSSMYGIKVCKRIQQYRVKDPVLYFKKIKHTM
jgi:hypothetical protein